MEPTEQRVQSEGFWHPLGMGPSPLPCITRDPPSIPLPQGSSNPMPMNSFSFPSSQPSVPLCQQNYVAPLYPILWTQTDLNLNSDLLFTCFVTSSAGYLTYLNPNSLIINMGKNNLAGCCIQMMSIDGLAQLGHSMSSKHDSYKHHDIKRSREREGERNACVLDESQNEWV